MRNISKKSSITNHICLKMIYLYDYRSWAGLSLVLLHKLKNHTLDSLTVYYKKSIITISSIEDRRSLSTMSLKSFSGESVNDRIMLIHPATVINCFISFLPFSSFFFNYIILYGWIIIINLLRFVSHYTETIR